MRASRQVVLAIAAKETGAPAIQRRRAYRGRGSESGVAGRRSKPCKSHDGMHRCSLCWTHHRAYDTGGLELLPHLEPQWRAEVAHAVSHLGLIGAVRRLAPGRR